MKSQISETDQNYIQNKTQERINTTTIIDPEEKKINSWNLKNFLKISELWKRPLTTMGYQ